MTILSSALYAELAATSNFSFLHGASSPEELVSEAGALGLSALGLTDRNSVAGVVRAHAAAKERGLRFLPGARLVFADGTPDILAYPRDRAAWGRLCRLLTLGRRRAAKGACDLGLGDLAGEDVGGTTDPERRQGWGDGFELIVMPPAKLDMAVLEKHLARLVGRFPGAVWLAAAHLCWGDERHRLVKVATLSETTGVPLIAVGDVLYHVPDRRPLQDVLACIRARKTLDTAGRLLVANTERHLKDRAEMARLFEDRPEALEATQTLVDRCGFSLDGLRDEYPDDQRDGYETAQAALEAFTAEGVSRRYGQSVPDKVRIQVAHELELIKHLGDAPYVLAVHDIVRFARSRGILTQGRGSAAHSAVCYCLGITEIDPATSDLLFERAVSAERGAPPDIDVDVEHERREEVIQYLYARYGRARAGLAATVISYRLHSALCDVGKVFGLSDDILGRLAATHCGATSEAVTQEDTSDVGVDPDDPRLVQVLALAAELAGFPCHLSQDVGGFVITRGRLDELVPIENVAMADHPVVEWDKDDLDTLGLLKVDVLALGLLSCLRRAFDLMAHHYAPINGLAAIPGEDPAVYAMLSRADSLGVFQVDSRAQRSLLLRLKPRTFYDLVIEVAIMRAGSIQGDRVQPYLRRRQGLEPVHCLGPKPGDPDELKPILGQTLGVLLFQEQALRIAIVAAGFTPTEADRLRRAGATFRRMGKVGYFCNKMVEGMVKRGYPRKFAELCFLQIEGGGEYGCPESHAASVALLVYASAWIKCHYPDVFAAALLNSQPMGSDTPAQIVRNAVDHGVEVRPVDINGSSWESVLEAGDPDARPPLHARHSEMAGAIRATHALRLGFHQIKGFGEEAARVIEAVRGPGFDSIRDLWLRSGLAPAVLDRLASANAFRSLGLDRREALWVVQAIDRAGDKDDLPLFAAAAATQVEPEITLPRMLVGEQVVADYRHLSLSLKAHPLSLLRDNLQGRGMVSVERLPLLPTDRRLTLAGLVLVRQRPGPSKGVIFLTLEDESGLANVVIWPKVFEQFRAVVVGAKLAAVTGRLQVENRAIHLVAEYLEDLSPLLSRFHAEAADGAPQVMPKGQDFQ